MFESRYVLDNRCLTFSEKMEEELKLLYEQKTTTFNDLLHFGNTTRN